MFVEQWSGFKMAELGAAHFFRQNTFIFLLLCCGYAVNQGALSLPEKEHRLVVAENERESLSACGYSSCNPVKEGMINVHLVPHSHDDLGWLITADQYYYEQVEFIIESVIEELAGDLVKRFSYVEVGMFARWFRERDEEKRNLAISLINQGRLEFCQGGWVTNDEAVSHYNADIDHQTYGFEFMRTYVGACGRPRAGWQIDPFGHSREQASLFARYGFDSLFFGRIDYQDKMKREANRTMEFIWRGSPKNLGAESDIFAGELYNEYIAPTGFCFDIRCNDPQIMDDPRLHDYNVGERVDAFLAWINTQAKSYTTDHLLVPMGTDYAYQAAHHWYKNLDKLIKYINQKQSEGGRVNLLYSTPSCYAYQQYLQNKTWTTKEDDFFPYAHRPHSFWTGYYTSRPNLKFYIRTANTFLQMSTQMDVLTKAMTGQDSGTQQLQTLAEAMATTQHHDAVTGTEKQVVAYDYAERLANGINECQSVVNNFLQASLSKGPTKPPLQKFCPLLNISSCDSSDDLTQFQVIVYNPVARAVRSYVRIPVTGVFYNITGPDGQVVPFQLSPMPIDTFRIPERNGSQSKNELFFTVDLPPLGFNVYFVSGITFSPKSSAAETGSSPNTELKPFSGTEDIVIAGKYISLSFSAETGLLQSITNLEKNATARLSQSFHYYVGHSGNNTSPDLQASGAYIFRPDPSGLHNFTGTASLATRSYYFQGQIVQEVTQSLSSWVTQVVRVTSDQRFAEFEWTVGPIPIDDKKGKEVISRFTTDLTNNGIFYTDSNGREVLERRLNHRDTWKLNQTEPVAGNYYPVCTNIYIKDEEKQMQFSVLPDRSQGGSSLHEGEIELMVHRRLLHDDSLGVGEALNETGSDGKGLIARGIHYVMLEPSSTAAAVRRDLAQRINMAPQLSFTAENVTQEQWNQNFRTTWSGVRSALPPNVNLLTLRRFWVSGPAPSPSPQTQTYLLRLEHFFEKDEDPELSQPVTLSLQKLFAPFDILSADELTLGANLPLAELQRLKWKTNATESETPKSNTKVAGDSFTVTLSPMEILTLQITIGPPSAS